LALQTSCLHLQFAKSKGFYTRSTLAYFASTTGLGISISITYILFLTKMQKRQTLEKEFALFKNDITGSELTVKILDKLQMVRHERTLI
jgi:hypothetical protein